MKRIVSFIVFLSFFACLSSAQDVITRIDGTSIEAKVLEVSDDNVKYQRVDYPDGPVYIVKTQDLSVIRYQNGRTEYFNDKADNHSLEHFQPNTTESVCPGMSYGEYRRFYEPRNYSRQEFDPYSPVAAGICSYFIPGLGQMIDGEILRGIGFLVGSSALTVASFVAIEKDNYAKSIISLCGLLALDIFSITDAIRVAKIKNMYEQDLKLVNLSSVEVRFMPTFAMAHTSNGMTPTTGVGVMVRF